MKKQLPEKHRFRPHACAEELANGHGWPNDFDEETFNLSKLVTSGDKPRVSEVRWESEARWIATLANVTAPNVADVESKTSSILKPAKAKIQMRAAEVAKVQAEPSLASIPVNRFPLTKNDDEK